MSFVVLFVVVGIVVLFIRSLLLVLHFKSHLHNNVVFSFQTVPHAADNVSNLRAKWDYKDAAVRIPGQ